MMRITWIGDGGGAAASPAAWPDVAGPPSAEGFSGDRAARGAAPFSATPAGISQSTSASACASGGGSCGAALAAGGGDTERWGRGGNELRGGDAAGARWDGPGIVAPGCSAAAGVGAAGGAPLGAGDGCEAIRGRGGTETELSVAAPGGCDDSLGRGGAVTGLPTAAVGPALELAAAPVVDGVAGRLAAGRLGVEGAVGLRLGDAAGDGALVASLAAGAAGGVEARATGVSGTVGRLNGAEAEAPGGDAAGLGGA
ncbi:MAG TPA: hypothetical protein VKZ49_02100 [Polyangiaceae bacterium]|nr:hypothetical protein [Polyangiaceae bacterium]